MSVPVYLTGGRLVIEVAWQEADGLYAYLRRNGISGTQHLNLAKKTARIEPADGTDPHQLRFLVAQWRACHPA
jgi:hypothetical protein